MTDSTKAGLREDAADLPSPCQWGGGNDVIWCSTCHAEYAYAKGETRPECPRARVSGIPVEGGGGDAG